jgi:hypothetical protein
MFTIRFVIVVQLNVRQICQVVCRVRSVIVRRVIVRRVIVRRIQCVCRVVIVHDNVICDWLSLKSCFQFVNLSLHGLPDHVDFIIFEFALC